MTTQWGREWSLLVGASGSGRLIKDLRVVFSVEKTAVGKPNDATIKIYNMSPKTEGLLHDEYTDIVLNAGYKGASGLIFKGNISLVSREKSGADTIAEVTCGDGDQDYRTSVINVTLAAGATTSQAIQQSANTFTNGTTAGTIQVPNDIARPRGRVLTGATRDVLESLARSHGCDWSIQDGKLQFLPSTAVLPGQAILVSPATGMVGAPSVTDKGIKVKTLLNPQYAIGGTIKIDSKYAQVKASKKAPNTAIRMPPNGICKIVKITHTGDTRGSDWYSEIEATGT